MDIVLGGKFEAALIRAFEETNRPERLPTSHPYYLSLHRWTERVFFERLGTFIALANSVEIAGADWMGGREPTDKLRDHDVALRQGAFAAMEDRAPYEFAAEFLAANTLPTDLMHYISSYHTSDLPIGEDPHGALTPAALHKTMSENYILRLTEQLSLSGQGGKILLLDERDLRIIGHVAEFLRESTKFYFPFPDLPLKTINGLSFAGGILNFSPQDPLSLRAVRADEVIRRYADHVRNLVADVADDLERERKLVEAMREARGRATYLRNLESVIETSTLVAAPITYIPVVGNVASILNDAAALGALAAGKAAKVAEWYLLGIRAATVSVNDYLARKDNL